MIKPLFSLLALMMMMILPLASNAQTATTSTDEKPGYRLGQPFSSEVRREYQEKRDELLEKYQAEKSEVKDDWQRERQQLFIHSMINRLNAALDRSRLFINRIENLIAKWEADGKTVTEVETTLTEAKDLLIDSQQTIDGLLPAWTDLSASTTASSSSIIAAKDLVREAVNTVKAVHAKVVEAVQELKVINSANN